MPYFPTMQPIKTTHLYVTSEHMYVVDAKYMDSLRIRNLCGTIDISQKENDPDNITFYKVFLNDSEIVK